VHPTEVKVVGGISLKILSNPVAEVFASLKLTAIGALGTVVGPPSQVVAGFAGVGTQAFVVNWRQYTAAVKSVVPVKKDSESPE